MQFIAHRVNKAVELVQINTEYGVELDLRDDKNGRIILQHDPFAEGECFDEYLSNYRHGILILNIKSERIEIKVQELMKKYSITDYFFLDSTFPMIKLLTDNQEQNIALRFSEFEGIDTIKSMAGKVDWIWVDCFSQLPINYDIYLQFKSMGYKLCLVSPELQGQPEKIDEYGKYIVKQNINFDAICTKHYFIDKWKEILKDNF